jgi:DNA mismatch endonuclease (patch repair protein)
VKGRDNRATELRLMGMFRAYGIKGWRRNARLFGKPDFIFPELRTAVFVDGCFWHGCPLHGSIPESNRTFWKEKLARNKKRDRIVKRRLDELGWKTVRIWQHELRKPDQLIRRFRKFLQQQIRLANRQKASSRCGSQSVAVATRAGFDLAQGASASGRRRRL